jgi:hypothetical protein
MGRQINFFMVQCDESDLLTEVEKGRWFVIDASANRLTVEEAVRSNSLQLFFANGESRIINYSKVDQLDPSVSDVIEFSRSRTWDGKVYRPGRLWAEMNICNHNHDPISRKIELEKFFNKLVRYCRKWTKVGESGCYYVAPNALRFFSDEGFVYRINDFARMSD